VVPPAFAPAVTAQRDWCRGASTCAVTGATRLSYGTEPLREQLSVDSTGTGVDFTVWLLPCSVRQVSGQLYGHLAPGKLD
jgi:hypothetical protein